MSLIVLIMLIIMSIFLCWKYGDWRNWKLYYPTITYLIIGDLAYNILTNRMPLWSYNIRSINNISTDFLITAFIYPCTVIMFLTYYPRSIKKQVAYIVSWVFTYSVTEYIASISGSFLYFNGWSIGWSILFNCIMFPLLYLHYKKPLWVWPISMALAFLVLHVFRIPLIFLD